MTEEEQDAVAAVDQREARALAWRQGLKPGDPVAIRGQALSGVVYTLATVSRVTKVGGGRIHTDTGQVFKTSWGSEVDRHADRWSMTSRHLVEPAPEVEAAIELKGLRTQVAGLLTEVRRGYEALPLGPTQALKNFLEATAAAIKLEQK